MDQPRSAGLGKAPRHHRSPRRRRQAPGEPRQWLLLPPLYPLTEKPQADFYELYFTGHSGEDAQPHEPGTRENLVITPGRLEVDEDGVRHELTKGDAIIFGADVPHAYINSSNEACWADLVMTYVTAPDAPPGA